MPPSAPRPECSATTSSALPALTSHLIECFSESLKLLDYLAWRARAHTSSCEREGGIRRVNSVSPGLDTGLVYVIGLGSQSTAPT